ncbi:hypothetical protein BDV40DRAFT_276215 [Aspergillus tamarii]|uniref:Uncharacterized protein n=1 Tax=Aspergillus tamarii TaxID=41984 RepID=A0A5N6UIG4_ASPTM|nr:hypothetical protein BDV40DRAFT_276215 [Aspergillus tamarii]
MQVTGNYVFSHLGHIHGVALLFCEWIAIPQTRKLSSQLVSIVGGLADSSNYLLSDACCYHTRQLYQH